MSKKIYSYIGRPSRIYLCRNKLDLVLTRQKKSQKHKNVSANYDKSGRYRLKIDSNLMRLHEKSYEVDYIESHGYPCVLLRDALIETPSSDRGVRVTRIIRKSNKKLVRELGEAQCKIIQLEKEKEALIREIWNLKNKNEI